MKTKVLITFAFAITIVASITQADVLELKNGKVMNGKYVGGTAGTIRFDNGQGVQVIETGQALALTFTASGPSASAPAGAAAVAPAAAPAQAAPAPAPSTISIPVGTAL